ncbi:MAG: hypothetical protein KDD61_17605 [Bdellovibrionales bacterium]|nr:hypothetical protein [Bdellovibrionales bacterium]
MKLSTWNQKAQALTISLLLFVGIQGCGKQQETEIDPAIYQMSENLEAVEKDFVPTPLSITSTNTQKATQKAGDLCEKDDFFSCQPKLLKHYIKTSKDAFIVSRLIVFQTALNLGPLPNGTTGHFHIERDNIDVDFSKESAIKFKMLLKRNGKSIGFIHANETDYKIQLDIDEINQDKNSRGGKIDISVSYKEKKSWITDVTITDASCDNEDVKSPESARILVKREQEMWTGQSTFYNSLATKFDSDLSCDSAGSADTGLVTYTDFVSSQEVSKSAIYIAKANLVEVSKIEDYGISYLCTNYPSICKDLGVSIGFSEPTALQQVSQFLQPLVNPICIYPGVNTLQWGSDCSEISGTVANAPFLSTNEFIAPWDFANLKVILPDGL